jgi:hypothetical protein
MYTKKWFKSKTLRLNIVVFLLLIIPIVGSFLKIITPQSVMIIDSAIGMLTAILNVILRVWFTDSKIIG